MKIANHVFCSRAGVYLAYREKGVDGADLLFGKDAVAAAMEEVLPGAELPLSGFSKLASVVSEMGLPSHGPRRPVPSAYVPLLTQAMRVEGGDSGELREWVSPRIVFQSRTSSVVVPTPVQPPATPYACGFLVGINAERVPTVVGFMSKEHAVLEMRKRRWDRYRTTQTVVAKIRGCALPDRAPIELFELSGPFARVVAGRFYAFSEAFFAWKQRS